MDLLLLCEGSAADPDAGAAVLLGPPGAGAPTQASAPAADDVPPGLAAVGVWPPWADTVLVTEAWAPAAALATWLSEDLPASNPPSMESSFVQTFYDVPLPAHGHGSGGDETPTSERAPVGGGHAAAALAGLSVQAQVADQELSSDDSVGPCEQEWWMLCLSMHAGHEQRICPIIAILVTSASAHLP